MRPPIPSQFPSKGFSLVELLGALVIIALVATLLVPAMTALQTSGNVNACATELTRMLEQARVAAMAQNTYVWVGFYPMPANASDNRDRVDRVFAGMVFAGNGRAGDLLSGDVLPYSKLREFRNVALSEFPSGVLEEAGREMEGVEPVSESNVAPNSDDDQFSLSICGGSAAGGTTGRFQQLIQFAPNGEARVKEVAARWIEIGFKQSPQKDGKNIAILQVNGLTGQVRTFRP